MLNLPSKSPASRMDYGWDIPVDPDDTVSSATISVVSGDVVIDGQYLDVAKSRLIFTLSGGTAGTVTRFYVVANTAGNDIWDDTIDLLVSSNAATPTPVSPYSNPTPADIKADFPTFATVDDAVIQRRIDRGPVDLNVPDTVYTFARELAAAHELVMDGIGGGTDAELSALGVSGVSRLRSGSLDVSFADGAAAVAGDGYAATAYGRRLLGLLNKGPLITGNGACGYGDAATDLPFAWRWGGVSL